jgi:hypothetical protein
MKKQLSSGLEEQVLERTYPETIDTPSMNSGSICFTRKTTTASSSREVFYLEEFSTAEVQLTDNIYADADPVCGTNDIVYEYGSDTTSEYGLRFYSLTLGTENSVIDNVIIQTHSFDGTQWVAFVYNTSSVGHLYKYDVTNSSATVEQVSTLDLDHMWMSFEKQSHTLVGGFTISGVTDSYDILTWNMETNEYSILVNDEWDQGGVDADGHLIGYLDSQANDSAWFGVYRSEVRIVDRDTLVKRVVLPLDTYYGLGLWSHYLAVNNVGTWGDSIVLCDLEVMGLVDADGHVIPEGAEMDAGVDAGG